MRNTSNDERTQTRHDLGQSRWLDNIACGLLTSGTLSRRVSPAMGENIDDSYITSSVKTKLASDKLVSLTRVEVETNNGVVYLTGQVQNAEQRSHIGSLASRVGGVKKVVNNLQVVNR